MVQTQPLAQSALMLHGPPQVAALDPLRNWLAETAPAHRTEAMMVVNSVVLAICLNMVRIPFGERLVLSLTVTFSILNGIIIALLYLCFMLSVMA